MSSIGHWGAAIDKVREGEVTTPIEKSELHRIRARLLINKIISYEEEELPIVVSSSKVGKDTTSFNIEARKRRIRSNF